MKARSFFLRCLRSSVLLFASAWLARADAPSDPVGSLHLVLLGGSDTIVSLPLHRPPLIETAVASLSGSQLTLNTSSPSLPAEGAFALVMTGTMEGAVFPVTAVNGNIVTVDATGFDLSVLQTVAANVSGDIIAVIPYWTLDTVFPAGAGVVATTNLLTVQTQILMYSDTTPGINLSASATYLYYAGDSFSTAGWYRFGSMSATVGTTRFAPNSYFIVRHPTGSVSTDLFVNGKVQMSGARISLATLAANRAQDNAVALPVPVPMSLSDSLLKESGAFASTTNMLSVTDELLVFNNATIGHNKSASAVYFYYAGDGFYSAGWYRFGDMSQTVGTLLLNPGEGYIVRKAASVAAQANFWSFIPSYLP